MKDQLPKQFFAPDLAGFTPAPREKKKESAVDRLILNLKATGMSNKKIAETLQISTATVSVSCRQPWFMRNLVNLIKERGDHAIDKLLETISEDAINVAYEIMMDENAGQKLRAEAAFNFIKVSRGSKIVVEELKSTNLEGLKDEEAQLRREIDELTGGSRERSPQSGAA